MWPIKLGKLPAVVLTENINKIPDFELIEEKVKSAFLLHSASVHHFSVRISFTLHCENEIRSLPQFTS